MTTDECLPANLRGATITPIAAGLSGAGVYRVEAAGGELFVLKISSADEPLAEWQRKREVQIAAAAAGLAPRVVHIDEMRRAVVTAFVLDRSFPALLGDPRTRDAAIVLLGTTIRRVHELALPSDMTSRDPRELLGAIWAALADFALPAFVGDAVRRALAEAMPPRERAVALCHNDINPTNLVYDGEHVLLIDWDAAGPNDPLYDLAAISVFLRMDDDTCRKLVAAHDGAPVATVPAGLVYYRRLVAALCGAAFLDLARQRGHAGGPGETLESVPALADFYHQLRTGAVSVATAEGQWRFGLALVKTSVS